VHAPQGARSRGRGGGGRTKKTPTRLNVVSGGGEPRGGQNRGGGGGAWGVFWGGGGGSRAKLHARVCMLSLLRPFLLFFCKHIKKNPLFLHIFFVLWEVLEWLRHWLMGVSFYFKPASFFLPSFSPTFPFFFFVIFFIQIDVLSF